MTFGFKMELFSFYQDKIQEERITDYSPLLRGDEEMQKIRKTSNASQVCVKFEHSTGFI